MSYYNIKHYVIYHNEVIFVDPKDWPDGKWRRKLPPKVGSIRFTKTDKIGYQNAIPMPTRFAVRRIRHVGFDPCVRNDGVLRFISGVERIGKRKRLHDAEKEMSDASGMLDGAISARIEFKDRLRNGLYADGQNGTDAAIRDDRNTAYALSEARVRAVHAAKNLYPMLVGYGTITMEECTRRIEEFMAKGGWL